MASARSRCFSQHGNHNKFHARCFLLISCRTPWTSKRSHRHDGTRVHSRNTIVGLDERIVHVRKTTDRRLRRNLERRMFQRHSDERHVEVSLICSECSLVLIAHEHHKSARDSCMRFSIGTISTPTLLFLPNSSTRNTSYEVNTNRTLRVAKHLRQYAGTHESPHEHIRYVPPTTTVL